MTDKNEKLLTFEIFMSLAESFVKIKSRHAPEYRVRAYQWQFLTALAITRLPKNQERAVLLRFQSAYVPFEPTIGALRASMKKIRKEMLQRRRFLQDKAYLRSRKDGLGE